MKWKMCEPPQELTWKEARASFASADPAITKIIDDISPDDSFKLIRVRYPYGALIYELGKFFVPTSDGEIHALDHASVPSFIRDALSYSSVPLGCVTLNSFEAFKQVGDHVSPVSHRRTGLDLGIWEAFMPASPFTVTAGSRSVFMLPKITDMNGHKKLKKYGVKGPSPFNPFDQWYIFREMANHEEFSQDWYCEVIFLSKNWFDAIFNDPAWIQFYSFLLLKNIKHTEPHRIKVTHDNIWENFSLARSEKRMKTSPHIVETFKHLIFIATGVLPGFKVVADNTSPGPIQGIVDAYLNEYGLKTYAPTVMYADYFNKQPGEFVYYSLQIPTSSNSITKNKTSSTARSDMIELLDLIDDFIFELNRGHLGPGSDYMYNLYSEIQFDFFHSEEDTNEGLYPSLDMPNEDPKLIYTAQGDDIREFCSKASFVRGCVRISRK